MAFASLKYDYIFRNVFSRESILGRFLSDVTGIPLQKIKSVRVINSFLWKRHRNQKQGILDIALILNDNTRIDIELQVRAQKFWVRRMLFYLAQMYTEDLRIGEHYEKLRKCIVISILDFDLIPETHIAYTLRDRNGRELTDLFELHIIELSKELIGEQNKDIKMESGSDNAINDWVRLFNADTMEKLNSMNTQNEGVLEAMEVVRSMNMVKSLRMRYEMHLRAMRDRWAEDEYVRDEGRTEGRSDALAGCILRTIERFGEVPEGLQERIVSEKDVAVLERWFELALNAESMQEFEQKAGLTERSADVK